MSSSARARATPWWKKLVLPACERTQKGSMEFQKDSPVYAMPPVHSRNIARMRPAFSS